MGRKRFWIPLGLLTTILIGGLTVAMYSIAAGEESPPPLKLGNLDVALGGLALSDEDGAKSDPRWSKIGPDLAALPAEYQDHAAQGGPGPFEPGNPLMRVRDGFVVFVMVSW